MTSFPYVGSELDLFARATTWKRYFSARIRPYLGDDVLEVGAGIGGTTPFLCTAKHRRWLCLEPDAGLAAILKSAIDVGTLPACCRSRVGTVADLPDDDRFDAILYIDVLEHIADDRAEVERAAAHLAGHGRLIVLAPAHQWLFTPFDEAIGHHRRYSKKTLAAAVPGSLEPVRIQYLDSVGMIASMGNRFLLGSGMPTPRQLWVWDKLMVPLSRIIDPLLFGSVGKSILGVWQIG